MAEGGELTELISQYLETQAIIGFNNVSSLSNAENLANGSFARTYGKLTYNDGKGAFYKIRERNNADVPDGDNLIVLVNTQNLVAEKIRDYRLDNAEDEISNINDKIKILNKKYVFIGDSYADGWTQDNDYIGWIEQLPVKLGLTSSEYISYAHGGYRFDVSNTEQNYINSINNVDVDNNVTDVIVAGGFNDINTSYENLKNGILAFKNKCLEKYPNAKLHIAFIGGSNIVSNLKPLKSAILNYIKACNSNNIHYLKGCEYSLHSYFSYFSNDGIHPVQAGQDSITNALFNSINFNDANIVLSSNIYFNPSHGAAADVDMICDLKNGFINFYSTKTSWFNYVAGSYPNFQGSNEFELGTLNWGLMIGNNDNECAVSSVQAIINDGSKYRSIMCDLIIKNKKLLLKPNIVNSTGSSYDSFSVKSIELYPFNTIFNALNI